LAGRPRDSASAPEPEEDSGEGADERKAFLLRLPAPLLAELRRWASHEVRSLNGQVEYLLREAVKARRTGGSGT
jgi:hypothetical protein